MGNQKNIHSFLITFVFNNNSSSIFGLWDRRNTKTNKVPLYNIVDSETDSISIVKKSI